jgi:hypothetical protein
MPSYNIFCSYCGSKIFETDRACNQCGAPTKNPIIQEKKDNNTDTLDPLEPFSFIAGTDFELMFSVCDEGGVPLDLSTSIVKWTLSPYGESWNTITIDGIVVEAGVFIIKVSGNKTRGLSGRYVHTPILISSDGSEYYINQGVINIIPSLL